MFALPSLVPAPSLSYDELAIGEILLALKRDPVVHESKSSSCFNAHPVLLPGTHAQVSATTSTTVPYRNKMDLKVKMPPVMEGAMYAGLSVDTISPVASALYSMPPPAQSPSDRAKRFGPVIQLEDLRKCFNMPIAAVARQFGICATLLKKICRRHNIQRWPHRQIRSLQKSIDMLRDSLAIAKGSNKEYITKKIAAFEYTLECIMRDPNTAAKGISTGRLASPASEEMAKRAKRAKTVKKMESYVALAAALSEEEDEEVQPMAMAEDDDRMIDSDQQASWLVSSSSASSVPSPSTRTDNRKSNMSISSILC